MGRRRRYDGDDYHERLKDLKNKLRPFRNKHTAQNISIIIKSSNLPRHWDNIQRILLSNPSCQTVQKCLQNVADDITSRNHVKRTMPKLDVTVDLAKKLNQVDISPLVTAGNQMNRIHIKPSVFNFNTMSCDNRSGSAIPSYEVHDINTDPSANKSNTVNYDKTKSSEIMINKLEEMHLSTEDNNTL